MPMRCLAALVALDCIIQIDHDKAGTSDACMVQHQAFPMQHSLTEAPLTEGPFSADLVG